MLFSNADPLSLRVTPACVKCKMTDGGDLFNWYVGMFTSVGWGWCQVMEYTVMFVDRRIILLSTDKDY